jgi:lysylphosphatidylglycerol synthetase-like protein (DUF2156 family)
MNTAWRAQAILADPNREWSKIEAEPSDAASVLTGYVVPLALVPALSGLIGACVVGAVMPDGTTVRATVVDGLFGAVFGYVATCATVLLLGLAIDLLAPLFGGRRDFDNAVKLAVYSYTPVWLVGICLLAPGLRFLMLAGLYGVRLLLAGLPPLMKVPSSRVPALAAIIVAAAGLMTVFVAAAQHAMFGFAAF